MLGIYVCMYAMYRGTGRGCVSCSMSDVQCSVSSVQHLVFCAVGEWDTRVGSRLDTTKKERM